MNKELLKSKQIQKIVGSLCREKRMFEMCITLNELSLLTGISIKTLSGFENGRSSNIQLFYTYLTFLNNEQISQLINDIFIEVKHNAKINR